MALKSSVNKLRQIKTSFASGELDPLMNFRSDTSAYSNGAKQLKNMNIVTSELFSLLDFLTQVDSLLSHH